MSQWTSRFPDAALLLGAWVEGHPTTADALATWQERHPARMQTLVDWAATDTADPLGSFLLTRWGWDDLRAISNKDPEAFDAFLHWVRSAPDAAVQIGRQADALRFAVQHGHAMASMNPAELAAHRPVTWTLTGRQAAAVH